jgi:CRISPR-associated protein Csx10
MPDLAIRLTLLAPAAIGELRSAAFLTRTLRYVPGSVVRGALARAWLNEHDLDSPVDRQRFLELFEGAVAFGPLHKFGSLPEPLSQLTHKYPSGTDCPRSFDAFTHLGTTCPRCGGLLQPGKGAIRGVAATVENHAQLPRSPGEDTQLFSRERLDGGQVFLGLIGTPDPDDLAAVRQLIGHGLEVWVGGRKSAGGGRARLEVADRPKPVRLVAEPDHVDLLLTSPGIFVDDFGLPADAPRVDELREVLGRSVRIEHRLVRWTTVGGWHAASKLPKPVERAVAPGSVYRIRTSGPVDASALVELQWRGLGLRRAEGYGAVSGIPVSPASAQELRRRTAPLLGLQVSRELMQKLLQGLRTQQADAVAWKASAANIVDQFISKAPPRHRVQVEALQRLRELDARDFGQALDLLEADLRGVAR